eukprot:snap_masked-scaffold_9-processed-gene-6.38-mRNA-1 protein AED:1.00 eAED:1.00 QI:0/0/0/0/1/1/2/0/89
MRDFKLNYCRHANSVQLEDLAVALSITTDFLTTNTLSMGLLSILYVSYILEISCLIHKRRYTDPTELIIFIGIFRTVVKTFPKNFSNQE